MQSNPRHQCVIYTGDPSLKLHAFASTMQKMMMDGYQCLYINSPEMVASMWSSLAGLGIDVKLEISNYRLLFSSEHVSEGEDFDVDQMLNLLESTLDKALKDGYKGLWASGDMTWELGPEKNYEKLLEYEWKLEKLFQRRKELQGICQYHCDTLPKEVIRGGLLTHQTIFVNETLSYLNPHYINSSTPLENKFAHPMIDKIITNLYQVNIEVNRKSIN